MKIYQVFIERILEVSGYFHSIPVKDKETAINLIKELRRKFLDQYPELGDNDNDSSWYIKEDNPTSFVVVDDYSTDDLFISLKETELVETMEGIEKAVQECIDAEVLS